MYKFEIGAIVVTRLGLAECEAYVKVGKPAAPRLCLIVGRGSDECCGGTQLFYAIHSTGYQDSKEPEANLVSINDPRVDEAFERSAAIERERKETT